MSKTERVGPSTPASSRTVREEVQAAWNLAYSHSGDRDSVHRKSFGEIADSLHSALSKLEQMEKDHEAMNELRENPGDLMWFGFSDNLPSWTAYIRNPMTDQQRPRHRPANDPTDAILGTGESTGD